MRRSTWHVPTTVTPSCGIHMSPKIMYIIGKDHTTIHQWKLDDNGKYKPALIYTIEKNPKALTRISGARLGNSPVHAVWKDPTTDSVCFINSKDRHRPECFRLSDNSKSLDTLEVEETAKGIAFTLSDGTPALCEVLGSHPNRVHLLELRGNKVEVSETIILPSVEWNFSRPFGSMSSWGTCAFDRGGDGTCYALASDSRLYQRLPTEKAWKHIAGVGGSTSFSKSVLHEGPPLTLELNHFMCISAGPNGDVLLSDGSQCGIVYIPKHGKNSYPFDAEPGRVTSVRWSYSNPSYCYIAQMWMIEKVMIPEDIVVKAHSSSGIQSLSSLFQTHPEVSDYSIILKDGSKMHLHRCILSARCPQFLDWLKTGPGVSDLILKTTLQYIYDVDVPSDVMHDIAPLEWIPLAEVATALSLKELAARCLHAFGRALFYADPEVCISTLVAVAKRQDSSVHLSMAQNVILERPDILIDRAHLLTEHPNILAWFTNNLALKLSQTSKLDHHRPNSLQQLGLHEPPADHLDRSRYYSDMISLFDNGTLTDMVLGGVPCHRAILIPRCKFVETALSSGFAEQTSFIINLSDERITESVVRRLLRYLYTMSASADILGEDEDELADILELADFLQLQSHQQLIEYCQMRVDVTSRKRPSRARPPEIAKADTSGVELSSQDGTAAASDDADSSAPPRKRRRRT